MNPPAETWTVAVNADTGQLQQELNNATKYGRQFGSALTDAFTGLAVSRAASTDRASRTCE